MNAPTHFDVIGLDRLKVGMRARVVGVDWPALKAMLYWPILAYLCAAIVYGAVVVAHPYGFRLHGAMRMILAACNLALTAWLWFASPLAPVVSVPSVAALVARVAAFFAHPTPFPLVTLATVILVIGAISAAGRFLSGLWDVILGPCWHEPK